MEDNKQIQETVGSAELGQAELDKVSGGVEWLDQAVAAATANMYPTYHDSWQPPEVVAKSDEGGE